jgi:hypothetical protein
MKFLQAGGMKIFRPAAWLLSLLLFVLTVVPATERPETGVDHNLEHFLPFAALGALYALGYTNQFRRLLLGGFIFAGLLELVQIPLPTRHARMEDFVIDAIAIASGICTVAILQTVYRSWRQSGLTQ